MVSVDVKRHVYFLFQTVYVFGSSYRMHTVILISEVLFVLFFKQKTFLQLIDIREPAAFCLVTLQGVPMWGEQVHHRQVRPEMAQLRPVWGQGCHGAHGLPVSPRVQRHGCRTYSQERWLIQLQRSSLLCSDHHGDRQRLAVDLG